MFFDIFLICLNYINPFRRIEIFILKWNTMNKKEKERRERIRESLLKYYQSDKGINHKRLLSELQTKRMSNYAKYLNENKQIKK